jgi:hypothetical protein
MRFICPISRGEVMLLTFLFTIQRDWFNSPTCLFIPGLVLVD